MNHASYTNFYQLSKSEVNKFLHQFNWQLGHKIESASEKSKDDWVTHFDLQISSIVESTIAMLKMPHYLLSEETWHKNHQIDFNQPLIILDPIDGTNGFRLGTKYFCLSLAVMEKGKIVSSWLWNFGTQEEAQFEHLSVSQKILPQSPIKGLVSDSEWRKKLWSEVSQNQSLELIPCGSIAYKLLLLSMGECHFVASKQPKNIWDIIAGTHILSAKGYKLYCENKEVVTFNKVHWPAPLLWCLPEDASNLSNALFGKNEF
jgi:myo-inositol-1(or 4)-monophosphatase